MTERSDDVFERVNTHSLRLDREAGSFRLTGFRWPDAPRLLVAMVGALMMLTGVRLGVAAVFTKDLLIDRDRQDRGRAVLQVAEDAVAASEALLLAMRDDDQEAIARCRRRVEELAARREQLLEREARRAADLAIAGEALRKRHGATAVGLIAVGLALLWVSQNRIGRWRGASRLRNGRRATAAKLIDTEEHLGTHES